MRTLEFEALVQSQTVRAALSAFGTLAGLPVTLIPPEDPPCHNAHDWPLDPLCRLVTQSDRGKSACNQFVKKLQGRLGARPTAHALQCFAGLTKLAVPVVVEGRAVAALVSGGFLEGKSGARAVESYLRRLQQSQTRADLAQVRQAYLRTPITPPAKLRAARELLNALAQHLGEMAGHCLLAQNDGDPPCVVCAKSFVERHSEEMPRTKGAAREAHVTEPYFCRIFKAATGMTFSEYVSRSHVDRSKQLLADRTLRITDVAFAAGFRSIPHFNHTFKRYTGVSPTDYRASLVHNVRR